MRDSCETCVHFRGGDPAILRDYGSGFGLCRYGPPIIAAAPPPQPPADPPVWPVVARTFWCPAYRRGE